MIENITALVFAAIAFIVTLIMSISDPSAESIAAALLMAAAVAAEVYIIKHYNDGDDEGDTTLCC